MPQQKISIPAIIDPATGRELRAGSEITPKEQARRRFIMQAVERAAEFMVEHPKQPIALLPQGEGYAVRQPSYFTLARQLAAYSEGLEMTRKLIETYGPNQESWGFIVLSTAEPEDGTPLMDAEVSKVGEGDSEN